MWKDFTPSFRNLLGFLAGILLVTIASSVANAVERDIGYALSTTNCLGETVDLQYYDRFELYIDVTPIQATGGCPGDPGYVEDVPPSAINTVAIAQGSLSMTGGQVTVDLVSGLTYYVRGRVRNTEGLWSQLSDESVISIPAGAPQMPTLFIITQ